MEQLLKVTTVERMIQFHVYEWEKLIRDMYPKCSSHVGHKVFQSFSIVDLKGLSYKQFNKTTRAFLKQITKIDQEYYPEHLGQMFIILFFFTATVKKRVGTGPEISYNLRHNLTNFKNST